MDVATPDDEPPRWQRRFETFGRALALLRQGVETLIERPLNELEREGLVQRFEHTWELSWNLLSDYLDHEGVVLRTRTPRSVLKGAFERGVIQNGAVWMSALDARNRMAHTYNFAALEEVVAAIRDRYLSLFEALWDDLIGKVLDTETSGAR